MRTKMKCFRVMRKLNQQDMAEQLGFARAYYGHVERGFQAGSTLFWQRLQQAFALTDEQLEELKELD